MRCRKGTPGSLVSKAIIVVVTLVFLMAGTEVSLAGDVTGKIRGIITDGLGAPLEGVTVTISDANTASRVYTVTTKKTGKFYYLGLEPAVHTVEATMEGYRSSSKQVRTRLGLWVEANMTLFKEGSGGGSSAGPKSDEEKAIEEFNGALLLIEEGKHQEALVALDRSIELDDMIYEPLQTKGQVYFEMGEFDKAKGQFDEAMEMGSTEPSNYFFLSEIFKSQGNTKKADEYSQLYLEEAADDVNVDVLFNMAAKALNESDDATARGYLEQIIAADPEYADAHRELGYVLIRDGDMAGAKEHFQKYLELSPDAADGGEISSMMEIL